MVSPMQPEPFRIRMVEPVRVPDEKEREEALERACFNMFGLASKEIYIDLLTDSGTGAMSKYQWAALLRGDEAYAGADSYYALKESVKEVLGFDYVIPTHQGRAAENVTFGTLLRNGDKVPFNMPFDTTRAHVFNAGAEPVDCIIDEAFDASAEHPFKGDVDTAKLEGLIAREGKDRIPLIMITVTNNSGGGQPVSLRNLREVSGIARKHGIPLFLDAARMAENAYFIKVRDPECSSMPVKEILRAMMDTADAITVSCKKDPLVNIGGMICCRTEEMYHRLLPRVILYEGFATYGGMAGRDLEALAIGLREMADEDYLRHRIAQVGHLAELLDAEGVPIVKPAGGHAIFVDAAAFFPQIPQMKFPADVLSVEAYREGAVRGIGLGALAFAIEDESTGDVVPPKLELYRLAVNRRTYTNSHIEYVASKVADVYKRRDKVLYGLEVAGAPSVKGLRHFLAKLRPVSL